MVGKKLLFLASVDQIFHDFNLYNFVENETWWAT